jgi:hypothetical protein
MYHHQCLWCSVSPIDRGTRDRPVMSSWILVFSPQGNINDTSRGFDSITKVLTEIYMVIWIKFNSSLKLWWIQKSHVLYRFLETEPGANPQAFPHSTHHTLWTRGPRAWRLADRSRQGKKPDCEMSLPVTSTWICMAIHFCHSCIFN